VLKRIAIEGPAPAVDESRGDAAKFDILGVAPFPITPYRYQIKAQNPQLNAQLRRGSEDPRNGETFYA
jgi:hypothetical protein